MKVEKDDRLICLNNKMVFEDIESAAKYANVAISYLKKRCGRKTYRYGAGKDSKTGESLYWLKMSEYDETKMYDLTRKREFIRGGADEAVVCLNTKEVFESYQAAADYAGTDFAAVKNSSGKSSYKRGAGVHPKTGERLYWIKQRIYDVLGDLEIPKNNISDKRVMCLNTKEIFENVEEAAKFAGVKPKFLQAVSVLARYKNGAGSHPGTGEKLYWLKMRYYNADEKYEIERKEAIKPNDLKQKMVCLNVRKSFGGIEEAATYANVSIKYFVSMVNKGEKITRIGTTSEGEPLFWVKVEEYVEGEEYELPLKQKLIDKKYVCLNTREIFGNATKAAKYGGLTTKYFVDNVKKFAGKTMLGKHPETKEKLYWLLLEDYDETRKYDISEMQRKKKKFLDTKVICLNNRMVFDCAEEAASYFEIDKEYFHYKFKRNFKKQVAIGKDPETGKQLWWLNYELYDANEKYELKRKSKIEDKRVICLNTRTIFEDEFKAAEYAGIKPNYLTGRATSATYKKGAGFHPETNEKLYWLRMMYFSEQNKEYEMPRIIVDRRVVCLNNLEVFGNKMKAQEFAGVDNIYLNDPLSIKKYSGEHPVTKEKLVWAKYSDVDFNIDYKLPNDAEWKVRERKRSNDQRVICLNTMEVFENKMKAGVYAGVFNLAFNKGPVIDKYSGKHPKTYEKLYWMKMVDYNEDQTYELPKDEDKSVVCVNTGKIFPNPRAAAAHIKIGGIKLNTKENPLEKPSGRYINPETEANEKLYWMRASDYTELTGEELKALKRELNRKFF